VPASRSRYGDTLTTEKHIARQAKAQNKEQYAASNVVNVRHAVNNSTSLRVSKEALAEVRAGTLQYIYDRTKEASLRAVAAGRKTILEEDMI
jgi:histone H3/H4